MLEVAELLERVIARRALRRSASPVAAVDLCTREALDYLRGVEVQAGWATQRIGHSLVLELAFCAIADDLEIDHAARTALWAAAVDAVLDGYELAGAVTGIVAAGQGLRFRGGVELSRFAARASRSGATLLAGPLGDVARRIVNDVLPGLPPGWRDLGRDALACAVAAGVRAFAREHRSRHRAFAGLATPAPGPGRPGAGAPAGAAADDDDVATDSALRAAILAAPDDDAPRLVYADWLAAQGDPRGELIHLQYALALAAPTLDATSSSAASHDAWRELETREAALRKQQDQRWLATLAHRVRGWHWRRGFLDHVFATAEQFPDALPALAAEPLRRATLSEYRPRFQARFAAAAPHPSLRRIDLRNNRIDDLAVAVVATPLIAGVHTVDLSGNPLNAAGLVALAAMELPALRNLKLSQVGATPAALCALRASRWWPRLTHIDLSRNQGIGGELVATLAAAPDLECAILSNSGFGDRVALELAGVGMRRLRTLVPSQLSARVALAIAASPGLPALEAFGPFAGFDAATMAALQADVAELQPALDDAF